MEKQYKRIKFNLNGRDVEQVVDVRASLTDLLRGDFSLTSVKKGCEVGECGACTVLINGETFNSCIYLAVWADGKTIRTVEDLTGTWPPSSRLLWTRARCSADSVRPASCSPGRRFWTAAGITPTRSCASSSPAICAAARAMKISCGR